MLPQDENPSLDQLFLFPNQLNKMKKWMTNRSGIILMTGPTETVP
jgi:competence protein ComGA